MILYRNCDRRYPFLWESSSQPGGRWHDVGEGPVQYLADTPYGAWAEFLRHEEIVDAEDLRGVSRALWAIDIEVDGLGDPDLPESALVGGTESYAACRDEARRLRSAGADGIRTRSAALLPAGATGLRVEGGFQSGPPRDGEVIVLFGSRPDAHGWAVVEDGRPPVEVLDRVRPL